MKGNYEEIEAKMKKVQSNLDAEFHTIRAGRANPSVLDKIHVDYYGTLTPVNQLAAIAVSEARILTITPWDASVIKQIDKAIQISDIGINPQNDGRTIRLVFPPLTEERRKELAKTISKYGEEAKISIRNVRRDAMEVFKAQKKKSEITEDDLKVAETDLQELTDKYCKTIDKLTDAKEAEILEV